MKNLLIIFCMAFFLISQTPSVSAVTKDSNSHNFIFVDIPNPVGGIGINFGISHFYDTIRLAGTTLPYFLTGFTGIGKAIMTPSNVFNMPLIIGICFGRQNCLELDAGLSIEYWDTRELPLESATRNAIKPVAIDRLPLSTRSRRIYLQNRNDGGIAN
ncbi:MAG: hypothetical protein IT283_06390 [Bacteroidetes bacterium]|nr:hypothetical protein [Bacteroidota bacterium]MCZ2102404.1 hypothetical protein [Chitinophagales bacterium]